MLVNCFLLWLVHSQGVQLSQLHQQNCWLLLGWCTARGCSCLSCTNRAVGLLLGWCTARGCSCLSCTNKTVGYCSVGALETSAPPESTP